MSSECADFFSLDANQQALHESHGVGSQVCPDVSPMTSTISPASRSCLETLMNLVYLCQHYADDPARIRGYMGEAQFHLDRIVEAEGLREGYHQERKRA